MACGPRSSGDDSHSAAPLLFVDARLPLSRICSPAEAVRVTVRVRVRFRVRVRVTVRVWG